MDTNIETLVETSSDQGIFFFGPDGPYFELSNFYSLKKLVIDGKSWPTTEHYFQASKFPDHPEYMELIRTVKSPNKAKRLGNQKVYGYSKFWKHDITKELLPDIIEKYPNVKIMSNWDTFRVEVMSKAVKAKFMQNVDLRKMLLETENRQIYEHSASTFWGNGGNGSGLNILGTILMKIRYELNYFNKNSSGLRLTGELKSKNIIPTKMLTFHNEKVPFKNSNWILDNLLVGEYPGDRNPKIHELKSIALVKIGVTDIISLIPKIEQDRLRSYRQTIIKYNKKIRFYDFPIKDMSIIDDQRTEKFVRVLIKSLSDKNKFFYLHCRGGHGRTGIIVSALIGLMFKVSSDEALNYCQALHFRRWKSTLIDSLRGLKTYEDGDKTYFICISPQANDQYKQVRRILDK